MFDNSISLFSLDDAPILEFVENADARSCVVVRDGDRTTRSVDFYIPPAFDERVKRAVAAFQAVMNEGGINAKP